MIRKMHRMSQDMVYSKRRGGLQTNRSPQNETSTLIEDASWVCTDIYRSCTEKSSAMPHSYTARVPFWDISRVLEPCAGGWNLPK